MCITWLVLHNITAQLERRCWCVCRVVWCLCACAHCLRGSAILAIRTSDYSFAYFITELILIPYFISFTFPTYFLFAFATALLLLLGLLLPLLLLVLCHLASSDPSKVRGGDERRDQYIVDLSRALCLQAKVIRSVGQTNTWPDLLCAGFGLWLVMLIGQFWHGA